jgi:hypothetical protein
MLPEKRSKEKRIGAKMKGMVEDKEWINLGEQLREEKIQTNIMKAWIITVFNDQSWRRYMNYTLCKKKPCWHQR